MRLSTNREIKFRAWDKFEEYFINSDEFAVNFYGTIFKANLDSDTYNNNINNSNLILMQYTELKDKNHVEIYEGDIVSCNINSQHKENILGYIEYVLGNWFIHGNDGKIYYFGGASNIKVIGNIYENPELLKG